MSACSVGYPGLIPGSGRSPGGVNGNPPQYSCLENSTDSTSPWDHKELDTTELLHSRYNRVDDFFFSTRFLLKESTIFVGENTWIR